MSRAAVTALSDAADRDESQTQVIDSCKQPMQRRLVDHFSSDQCHSLPFFRDLEPVEPGRPTLVKNPFHPDLVSTGVLCLHVHHWRGCWANLPGSRSSTQEGKLTSVSSLQRSSNWGFWTMYFLGSPSLTTWVMKQTSEADTCANPFVPGGRFAAVYDSETYGLAPGAVITRWWN